ncbi:CutA 1, chloroplastic-like protein [Drosera capensis]
MSSPLRFRSSASSILTSPHPLPFVGAVCLLSFGLSNLHSSLSSSTAAGGSLPVLRSRSVQARSKTEAAASSTVPSIVVYVTVPNKEAGVESVYEWKGEIQTDSEELLIIKTRESLLGALTEHVKANHEYE